MLKILVHDNPDVPAYLYDDDIVLVSGIPTTAINVKPGDFIACPILDPDMGARKPIKSFGYALYLWHRLAQVQQFGSIYIVKDGTWWCRISPEDFPFWNHRGDHMDVWVKEIKREDPEVKPYTGKRVSGLVGVYG